MSRGLKFLLFALGFLVATGLEAARADEAFLCEAGRVVHVPFGKLEEMKRTNACVAGHFGLAVAPAAAGPAIAKASAKSPPPARTAAPASPAPVSLRPLQDPGISPRAAARPQRLAGPPLLPRAVAGTDYRNVPVINAAADAPRVYLHQR